MLLFLRYYQSVYEMEREKVKRKEKALALLLSAVCAVPGVGVLPVQAEVSAAVSLEEGLTGYWNFDGGDPMANLAP